MEQIPKFNRNFDPNIFLRSCEKEVIEPIHGKITGTIPTWLNGALLRNGPGMLKIGECKFKHLFDSMAFLQRFEVKDGKVTFQCRFLQSDIYKGNTSANRIVFTDFGTSSVPDPCHSIFQKFFSFFETKKIGDNANISLYPFGDEIYGFAETPFMFKIDKETLNTEEKFDMRKLNIVVHSSHPHVTEDGSVYNLALSKFGPFHSIVRFPHKPQEHEGDYSMYDRAEIVASIPARWRLYPSYMHSFGITTNYFVIVEQPATISLMGLSIARLMNRPVIECLKFYPDELTQISVVSRSTGKLSYKFYTAPFFYFHIINQYEEDNHLVLDICSYDNTSILYDLSVDSLKDINNDARYARTFKSIPIRLVLPLMNVSDAKINENLVNLQNTNAKAFLQENGSVFAEWEKLTEFGCELPTINYQKYRGLKYQYFYAIIFEVASDYPGSINKIDTINKTVQSWYEKNCYANEPIFVPNPNPKNEDDGVLLSNVVWGGEDTHRTGLIVLDAKTMKEIGRAVFDTPGAINIGFHGWYCAN